MCGIVGAIAQRDITSVLLQGLSRLEYRGYDSSGLALLNGGPIQRLRTVGRVFELEQALKDQPLTGNLGIAHTRWATHGRPSEINAHPHLSGDRLAVVHNGIIENHQALRRRLQELGYTLESDTDTEVIGHLLDHYLSDTGDILGAFRQTLDDLEGAYALGVIFQDAPDTLYCARMGSPLVIGVGEAEFFVASDTLALLPVTNNFIYMDEGEYGCVTVNGAQLWNAEGKPVPIRIQRYEYADYAVDMGGHRHFMHKEIHEQPRAIADTLEGKLGGSTVLAEALGPEATELLARVGQVHIIACGTSYHAGLVARYWIEKIAGLPCAVDVASEYRYRRVLVPPDTLFISISQSGETADTLAALRFAKKAGYLGTLALCNVPGSSLVRESELRLMTHAGPEIGVASTKAFTTQLTALYWLTLALAKHHGLSKVQEADAVIALRELPGQVQKVLELEPEIMDLSALFTDKEHALFLGRGMHYPIALEGALKLKEISYIHAEAYPAGELKHGPLALVDDNMPVVSVAPSDELLEKLQSNLHEVRARGGRLITFADHRVELEDSEHDRSIRLPEVHPDMTPILYTVPLQLLAYHVALSKGTDVDKPRNLAKSVTVE